MTETLRSATPQDVHNTYTQAQAFSHQTTWNQPKYSWQIENVQQLQQMSMVDLTSHLKQLLAAQFALDNLKQAHQQRTANFIQNYRQTKDRVNADFKTYTWQVQHPTLRAYFQQNQTDHLPVEEKINNADTRFAKYGLLGIIILTIVLSLNTGTYLFLNSTWTGLAIVALLLICFIAFVLLYFFAKLHLPFSQPIPFYRNHRIRALKRRIAKTDDRFCRENDRYNQSKLKTEFKYDESLQANRSVYVEQMAAEQTDTARYLQGYAQTIKAQIGYFPPHDTHDMRHLLYVYTAFLDGRATTWKEATTYIDQQEQLHHMQQTLVAEIRSAKQAITDSISQASQTITKEIFRNTVAINGLGQNIREQTQTINEWNSIQTSIMAYQTELLKNNNRKIGANI